jgi:uncharacterized membrane protein
MEYLPLIGVAVVVLGFLLRLRVTVIVVAAGLVTGLAGGLPLVGSDTEPGIIDTLGRAFANTRIISLWVLTLPSIGLAERYGLQEQARRVILRIPAATAGRLQMIYQFFRMAIVAAGIRIGSGHVAFSRPLVLPMALGAANVSGNDEAEIEAAERIRAATAASENYGNFFAQNLFFGASGVALVVTTLQQQGLVVDPRRVARWSIPIAIASVALAAFQYWRLDRWLARRGAQRT